MYRFATKYLTDWKTKKNRKPLVIRGARQVGKTFLVRSFVKDYFENLVEINFERNPELSGIFKSNNPEKIIQLLELQFNTSVIPGKSLLFLDEIQAAPEVFASLRFFYEEFQELHIIAAGSLLEFIFEEPTFSMPVGRIEYLYLGPMHFEEFLLASGKDKLISFLKGHAYKDIIPQSVHQHLMDLFRTFLVIGGMPESVKIYLNSKFWQDCEATKNSLLTTFQDDFNKYGKRIKNQQLAYLFKTIPLLVGKKFKYVNVSRSEKPRELAKALDLLCMARTVFRIYHSSSVGIPIGATINTKKFKSVFLDVGLMSTICGLNLLDYEKAEDIMLVNAGAVCEQYIGQELLFSQQFYREPELYYWSREKRGSSSEIDYVISEGTRIVPVEVKAGKSGTLKSLHLFLKEKECSIGVRFNSDLSSFMISEATLPDGSKFKYHLLSLPLYMVGQTRRLIRQIANVAT